MAAKSASYGLEVTGGLSRDATRLELRSLFEAFGPVDACWVITREEKSVGYLRFRFAASAKAAAAACRRRELLLAGTAVRGQLWEGPQGRAPQVSEQPSSSEAEESRRSRSRRRRRRKRRRHEKEHERRKRRSISRSSSGCLGRRRAPPAALPPASPPAAGAASPAPEPRSGLLEVSNMPASQAAGALEALLETLSPSLEMLPNYNRAKGSAVVRAWVVTPGFCRIELQSAQLVESTARIVDGILLFGQRLVARVAGGLTAGCRVGGPRPRRALPRARAAPGGAAMQSAGPFDLNMYDEDF